MSKDSKNSFEIRRKGVENLFDIIFILILIKASIYIFLGKIPIMSLSFVITLITICGMFYATRLAHKGHIAAGIIGIIVSIIQIDGKSIISIGIGLLLLIDSVMYLINYNKK